MAAAGAIISGVGAIAGIAFQAKAAKAQERAMEAQQKMQELADARARRRLLRETAIARGTAVNLASNLGAMGGSAVAGGLGGLMNQQMAQLGFQQQTLDLSRYITQQNIAQSRALSMGSAVEALGGLFKNFRGLPGSTVQTAYRSPNFLNSFSLFPQQQIPQAARAGY